MTDQQINKSTDTGDVVDTSSGAVNWEEHQDDNGNTYYYNTITGATSWEIPPEAAGGFTDSTDAYVTNRSYLCRSSSIVSYNLQYRYYKS